MKNLLFFLYILSSFGLFATDDKEGNFRATEYGLLPDKNYSLQQVLDNQDLPFVKNDTLHPDKNNSYWVRIFFTPFDPKSNEYYLTVNPAIDNTIYYLDPRTQKWESNQSGFFISNGNRHKGLAFLANGDSINCIYVHINLHDFAGQRSSFVPAFTALKADHVDDKENFMLATWLIVLFIICIYIFNIIVDFIVVREKTHIYYLVVLAGCILYVTAFHRFPNLLFDFRMLRYNIVSADMFYSYELSDFLSQISLMTITTGYTYLTSNFLKLAINLPFWDRLLKRMLFCYLACCSLFQVSILFTPLVFISEFNLISNLFIASIFLLLFVISVVSFRKRNKHAKLFLIANAIPFIIVIGSALYLTLYNYNSYNMLLLPYFGIISFSITFSVALAFRNRNIQNELKLKEIEAKTLSIENEKTLLQNELLFSKNKEIETRLSLEKIETENLQLKLDLKNREMVSSAINISQKNETFEKIKKQLDGLSTDQSVSKESLEKVKSMIRNNIAVENTWENFKIHFEQIHPDFFSDLLKKHPNLTQNELKLSSYLKLNLTNKEIAAFQNIDPDSVKKAKMRLKKKLNL
ncbi:MAG TPA: 7TM diverse intracellular signaling domain-containing protein [Bacteroidia bacterium]